MPASKLLTEHRRLSTAGAHRAGQESRPRGQSGASPAHSGCCPSAASYPSRCLAARANASRSNSGWPDRACTTAASPCFAPALTCARIALNHARRGALSTSTRSTQHIMHPPQNHPQTTPPEPQATPSPRPIPDDTRPTRGQFQVITLVGNLTEPTRSSSRSTRTARSASCASRSTTSQASRCSSMWPPSAPRPRPARST